MSSQSKLEARTGRSEARAQLLHAAERELRGALTEQERPLGGMHPKPTRDAVKQAWSQLAPMRARQLGDPDSDVLCELVSAPIEAFYEPIGRGSN